MRSLNQVTLLGNLTRDPELKQTPSGQSVCSFGIALNRSYKDSSGEWKEAADYVEVVAWGPLGERVSKWVKKGRQILIQGSLRSRSWEQDGQKRTKVEVQANDIIFMSDKGSERKQDATAEPAKPTAKKDAVVEDVGDEPINLDDIPF